MNNRELTELRKYIKKEQAAGKIREFKFSCNPPVLFVTKTSGGIRLYVDYRRLNNLTIKNRYPLPLAEELKERLRGAKIFFKIDLKNGYNLVRIEKSHDWKLVFHTKFSLFEYLVIPFDLWNTSTIFQAMINETIRDLLDEVVIVYFNNILIYSETEQEHKILIKKVLERLQKVNLCLSIKKSSFHIREVQYLGYIISDKGFAMLEEKVPTIDE